MPLTPETRLGPYEIIAPLGAGGMGEVYRARDPRLGRDVAIKALPDVFAADAERLARFEREARLLASLSHPNIAGILGLEEAHGARYLVLELVAGETLAARLARGPLPLDEALEVAGQVASGVEAAHEAGVIHRDLKPGNIMIAADGTVKVLDFGLARGPEGSSAPGDLSHSPTLTSPATVAGVILGTAAYMSPEQARGRRVDRRTDVWSFGCVLYEMLTGRQAFAGETVSDLIARVLEREPDWSALPAATPPRVRELLRRCLEKDARMRLRDIGEARVALADPRAGAAPAAAAPSRVPIAILVAATPLIVLGVLSAFSRLRPREPAPRTQLALVRAPSSPYAGIADAEISPDGRTLVLVGVTPQGKSQLYVRPLDTDDSRALEGTDGALDPFWSPDGRNVGFFADGRLKRVSVASGPPQVLADAPSPRGGSWGSAGTIVFAPTDAGGISVIPDAGGPAKAVAERGPREEACRWPAFLPDGRHFVYLADAGRTEDHWLRIGDTGGGAPRGLLGSAVTNARVAAPDWLFYIRGGALLAQHLDLSGFRLRGEPIVVARQIASRNINHLFEFSVSSAGTITYLSRSPLRQLAWFDRGGRRLADIGAPGRYGDLALSPDGRLIAYTSRDVDGRPEDVWILDPARGVTSRFTTDPASDFTPAWSRDGGRLAFGTYRVGPGAICVAPASGVGRDSLLPQTRADVSPSDWSPDGKWILGAASSDSTSQDVLAYSLDPATPTRPVAATGADEYGGKFSPDGRVVAYAAGGSSGSEVYVQDFPAGRHRVQVSARGAFEPHWTNGARELVFESPDGAVMTAAATGANALEFAAPRELFRIPRGGQLADVTRDGQRFVLKVPVENPDAVQIQVILGWHPPKP